MAARTQVRRTNEGRVHSNLTFAAWSVKRRGDRKMKGGRVRRVPYVEMGAGTCHVQAWGRRWWQTHHERIVHAYVSGVLVHVGWPRALPEGAVRFTYSPDGPATFTIADGRPLAGAARMIFDAAGAAWAIGPICLESST
jgi:hypothetical protein